MGVQKSTAEITRIVEETVQGLGYEFVDFERLPRGLMRITIDSQAEGGVGVDDCEAVSNQITCTSSNVPAASTSARWA